MKGVFIAVLLCVLCHTVRSWSEHDACKVTIYTRHLGVWGKKNVLICHVSKLSPPPQVTIDLLKNGQVISNTNQSDLAFNGEWQYYLTKHVPFNPIRGERYSCRVSCKGKIKDFEWEPDE